MLHKECLWIMEALKSKILDLERYDQQKRGSVKESQELYLVTNDTNSEFGPIWPFLEDDYS